jgi:hypothetical protein
MGSDIFGDDLIHLMVNETMDSSEAHTLHYEGCYNAKTHCVHVVINGQKLEFPEGFGPFKNYDASSLWITELDTSNDSDFLLSIINQLTNSHFEKVVISSDGGLVSFKLYLAEAQLKAA